MAGCLTHSWPWQNLENAPYSISYIAWRGAETLIWSGELTWPGDVDEGAVDSSQERTGIHRL